MCIVLRESLGPMSVLGLLWHCALLSGLPFINLSISSLASSQLVKLIFNAVCCLVPLLRSVNTRYLSDYTKLSYYNCIIGLVVRYSIGCTNINFHDM